MLLLCLTPRCCPGLDLVCSFLLPSDLASNQRHHRSPAFLIWLCCTCTECLKVQSSPVFAFLGHGLRLRPAHQSPKRSKNQTGPLRTGFLRASVNWKEHCAERHQRTAANTEARVPARMLELPSYRSLSSSHRSKACQLKMLYVPQMNHYILYSK